MRFDPNMFLRGYNPTPIEPESNALLRGIQMQGARQGNALNALKLQAAQQQMAEQQQAARRQQAIEGAYRNALETPLQQAGAAGMTRPTPANAAAIGQMQPRLNQQKLAEGLMPYDPIAAAKLLTPQPRKLMNVGPGGSVIDESGKVVYRADFKPEPAKLPAIGELQAYRDGLPPGDPRRREVQALIDNQTRPPKAAGGAVAAPGSAPGAMIPPADDRRTLAGSLGVPVAERDPFAGMSEKSAEIFKRSLYKDAEKRLTDVAEAAASAQSMARDVKQFLELQQGVSMQGPIAGRVPAFTSDAQTMDAITARITPQMRQPGSGATSDFDAKMFQMATVSRSKNDEANAAIGNAVILQAENAVAREQFMRDYLSVNGHLDGADRQWKRYIDANPIFDPKSGNVPKLNPARVPYQQFFGPGAAPAQPNPGKPAAPAAGAPARINSDAEYNALPSGATFVGPDGKTRRKP